MTSSISQQEMDMHFDKIEKEMIQQQVTESPTVYFRLGEESPLITSTLLYKPHRS